MYGAQIIHKCVVVPHPGEDSYHIPEVSLNCACEHLPPSFFQCATIEATGEDMEVWDGIKNAVHVGGKGDTPT